MWLRRQASVISVYFPADNSADTSHFINEARLIKVLELKSRYRTLIRKLILVISIVIIYFGAESTIV